MLEASSRHTVQVTRSSLPVVESQGGGCGAGDWLPVTEPCQLTPHTDFHLTLAQDWWRDLHVYNLFVLL